MAPWISNSSNHLWDCSFQKGPYFSRNSLWGYFPFATSCPWLHYPSWCVHFWAQIIHHTPHQITFSLLWYILTMKHANFPEISIWPKLEVSSQIDTPNQVHACEWSMTWVWCTISHIIVDYHSIISKVSKLAPQNKIEFFGDKLQLNMIIENFPRITIVSSIFLFHLFPPSWSITLQIWLNWCCNPNFGLETKDKTRDLKMCENIVPRFNYFCKVLEN